MTIEFKNLEGFIYFLKSVKDYFKVGKLYINSTEKLKEEDFKKIRNVLDEYNTTEAKFNLVYYPDINVLEITTRRLP
jgi:hypothetical protein